MTPLPQERVKHGTAASGAISTAQEDYLETIYHLAEQQEKGEEQGGVRVTDIADRLGVRLPPVTRAVQALDRLGLVNREERRQVRLTELGRRMAEALAHRHSDIVYLLTDILGVAPEAAEADACQMEHGISPETAQRLHEFLEHFNSLDPRSRDRLRADKARAAFQFLPEGRGAGWRA